MESTDAATDAPALRAVADLHPRQHDVVPDPYQVPFLTVEEGGALFGLGRSKSYIEARRFETSGGTEGLPVLRFGRTLRCPTARILELLGLHNKEKAA